MKNAKLCLLILFIHTGWLSAQVQLNGDLKSAYDNEPIAAAALFLEPGNQQTISDAKGRFSFENLPAGTYTLRVKHIGFVDYQQELKLENGKTDLCIVIEPKVELIQEAQVNGRSLTGGERGLKNLTGSAHYLGLKSLAAFEYNDINRVLRRIPGIYIQEEDGFGLRPNIGMRGTGVERSSKISLMEDGILAAPAPYSAPAAYYFPTTGRMEGIEVRKGSSQIEYGPYTSGGALNLISTQIPKAFQARFNLLAGNYGQRRLHAMAGQSFTYFGFMIETYQAQADGFKEMDFGGNTGFELADYQAKFRINTGPEAKVYQALELKLGQTTNNSDETYLGLSRDDYEANPYRRYAASRLDQMLTEHRQYQLSYRLSPSDGIHFNTTIYRNEFERNWYKLDKIYSNGSSIGIASLLENPQMFPAAYQTLLGAGMDTLALKNNNRSYYSQGIQSKLSLQWGTQNQQQLNLGLRYHEDGMDRFQWNNLFSLNQGDFSLIEAGRPGTESNRLEDARALAAFGEYRLQWNKWTLSPGLRYEHIVLERRDYGTIDVEREGTNLNERANNVDVWIPGIGIRRDWSPNKQIFAGVHRGFSPPGSLPDSKPELSINTEIGSRWQFAWFALQATLFYNDYQNLLGTDMAANGGLGSSATFNGGAAQVYGLEAELSQTFSAEQSAWSFPIGLTYTYTNAQFKTNFESDFEAWGTVAAGDELPYLAKHMLHLHAAAEWKRLVLNANWSYQSAMRTIAGSGAIPFEKEIPAQMTVDMSATYHLNYNISFFGTVRNLTNAVNLVSMRPAGLRPNMPRSILVGFKIRW